MRLEARFVGQYDNTVSIAFHCMDWQGGNTMDGDWNLKGCGRNDPERIRSLKELAGLIRDIGFLP